MNMIHIDGNIAGAKTLWILRFPQDENLCETPSTETANRPRVELLIPAPFTRNEWMIVSCRADKQWIDSFFKFQNMCEEAKNRCQAQIDGGAGLDPADKTKKAAEELNNFTDLIRYFNEIMRRFHPPEPPFDHENPANPPES